MTTHVVEHTSAQNNGLHCVFVFGVQCDPSFGGKPSINESRSLAYRDYLSMPMFERVAGNLPVQTTMCKVQEAADRQAVWHLALVLNRIGETLLTVSTFCTRVKVKSKTYGMWGYGYVSANIR